MYNLIENIRWKIKDLRFCSLFVYKMFIYKHQSKIISSLIYHSDKEVKTMGDLIAKPINKLIYKQLKNINLRAVFLSKQLKTHKASDPAIETSKRGRGSVPVHRQIIAKPKGTYFSRIPKTMFDWNGEKK